MQVNVGPVDAATRAGLATLCLVAAAFLNFLPVTSLLLAVIALILFGTALTRTCPFYRIFRISTRRS